MSHSSCRVCSENYVTRFSPWVRTSFVWPKFNNGWTWEMTEYPLTHDSNLKLTFLCIKVVEVQFLRTKKSVTILSIQSDTSRKILATAGSCREKIDLWRISENSVQISRGFLENIQKFPKNSCRKMLEESFGGVIVINAANLEVAVSLRNKRFYIFLRNVAIHLQLNTLKVNTGIFLISVTIQDKMSKGMVEEN